MTDLPRASRMVVHLAGREPVEVDGPRWEVDRICEVLRVDAFDAEGHRLWTQFFNEPMWPGHVLVAARPTIVAS